MIEVRAAAATKVSCSTCSWPPPSKNARATRTCYRGVAVTLRDGTEREVDVFGVWSAKVLSGEVKTSPGAFTENQLASDIELSESLGADIHLVAAVGLVSTNTRQFAERLGKKSGLEVIFLSDDDLRPADG